MGCCVFLQVGMKASKHSVIRGDHKLSLGDSDMPCSCNMEDLSLLETVLAC